MASRALRVFVQAFLSASILLGGGTTALAQSAPQSDPVDTGEMAVPAAPIEITPVEWYAEGFLAEVVFNDTPTGFKEKTLIYVPTDSLALGLRPALVVFHQYGKTHFDAYTNTKLIDECRARGWFCIAPLGATKTNFASLESQANVQLVLDCAKSILWPWLDRERIYGIGFSMGAGDASTYAARHVDPYSQIFAALYLHTGNHDKNYVWQTEPGVREILEFWFGGTPAQKPWEYSQASTVGIGYPSGILLAGDHQGQNLEHAAVYSFYAFQDPFVNLKIATVRLHQYLTSVGGVTAGSVNTANLSGLPTGHTWDTLDQHAACDWLAGHSISMPSSGRQVVDRAAQYWWFRHKPKAAGQFATLDWTLDRAARTVSIEDTWNLESSELPYNLVGFAAGPLAITTGSADASTDELILTGVMQAPAAVSVAGAPAVQGTDYAYDAATKRLTLHATGAPQNWLVSF